MTKFGMPRLESLSQEERGALLRKTGLSFIEEKGGEYVRLPLDMDSAEKEALIEKAGELSLPVLLEAENTAQLEKAVLWLNLWRNRMCEPDELWDIYDRQGNLTGKIHRRRDPLGADECHLCVHVWTLDGHGRFLLTKRSENKSLPGLWESTGGSVVAGEDSFSAALREVREETGIVLSPENGEFLFRYGGDNFLCDVWLFRQDFRLGDVQLLEGETCGVMAADKNEIRALIAQDKFVPYEYIEEFLSRDY